MTTCRWLLLALVLLSAGCRTTAVVFVEKEFDEHTRGRLEVTLRR